MISFVFENLTTFATESRKIGAQVFKNLADKSEKMSSISEIIQHKFDKIWFKTINILAAESGKYYSRCEFS